MRRLIAPALLLACALLAGAGAARGAEEVVVGASVDAERIGADDAVTLTIEVRGRQLPPVEEPALDGLVDLTIAQGPSTSTSTSMVWDGAGAQVTSTRRYQWVLLPKRRGELTIPSFAIVVGGKPFRTDPIRVEVVEGSARGRPGAGAPSRGPFGSAGRDRGGEPAGDVFVEATVDRREAFVGEQVLVTYKLYTQVELAALPRPQSLPAFTGFWVEEIPVDVRASVHRTVLRGKEYTELTLMKKAIYATKSGDLPIEESVFEIAVRVPSDDPFDTFFAPTRAIYRRTPATSIHVLTLPGGGRPASFHGAVGAFDLEVKADRAEAQVNDAVGLTVTVTGDGNLRTLGEPVLPELPDYRRFDPKVEDERRVEGDRILGTRRWSYVLVPLTPGDHAIAPVRFAYFDPAARAYREIAGPALPVRVTRAAGPGTGEPGGVPREVVAMRRDVRFIKPVSALGDGAGRFRGGALFWLIVALPIAGNAALWLHLRRRERLSAEVGLTRRRRASREARRRLKQARALAAGRDAAAFFAEMDRAVTGYIADKFDLSAAGLTRDAIDARLAERGVPAETRRRTIGCLEQCDFGRFAPGGDARARRDALLATGASVIEALERSLG